MPAAHNTYTQQLWEMRRGYPLYYPEPRPEGPVEIGDIGYTKDGAFRRLFNVSRPASDPIQRFGVPRGFVQLDLGAIDVFDAALEPGPLHSKTISTVSTEVGTPGEILPAEASFRFRCSSKRGAILVLETQMMREEAVQSRRLEAYVVQHCRSWHAFARYLDIHVGFGDLMLVTECSKTAAWSSAVYSNSSTEFGLSFSAGMPFSTAGISASTSLEKIGPVERRRSQNRAQAHGVPLPKDHTVFIKAYRVGMRQMYYQSLISLFMKAQSSSPTQRGREGTSQAGSRPPSTGPNSSSPPTSPSGSSIIGPYEPDFHPSLALLALEMEKNTDTEFVVLHDDVWCSMTPDSDGSRLMDEYTNFYFSDEVTGYLNSMLGEIPYGTEFQPSDVDESLPSDYPYLGMSLNGSLEEDMIPSDESPDPPPSFSKSPFELISPALSGEIFTSHSRSANETDQYIFPNRAQAISEIIDTSFNITSKGKKRLVHGGQRNAHDMHTETGGSRPRGSISVHIPGRNPCSSRHRKESVHNPLSSEIQVVDAEIASLISQLGHDIEAMMHTSRSGRLYKGEEIPYFVRLFINLLASRPLEGEIVSLTRRVTHLLASHRLEQEEVSRQIYLAWQGVPTTLGTDTRGQSASPPYFTGSQIAATVESGFIVSDLKLITQEEPKAGGGYSPVCPPRRWFAVRQFPADNYPPRGEWTRRPSYRFFEPYVETSMYASPGGRLSWEDEGIAIGRSLVRSWSEERLGPHMETIIRTPPRAPLPEEGQIADFVVMRRGIHQLAGYEPPYICGPWRDVPTGPTLATETQRLRVAWAYSTFTRIVGGGSDAASAELSVLVSDLWNLMSRGEREVISQF